MNSIQQSFEEFLNKYPYDLWLTVTFRQPIGEYAAKKRMKYFLKHLNRSDMVFYDKYIRLWVFFEKTWTREGVHVHGLIDGISSSKANLLEVKCTKHLGASRVTAGHAGAIAYLAEKYNTSKLSDFDYWKINT